MINGHSRILNWRYLPYIRPIFQAYVRKIPTEYGLRWYSTSILGSWNSIDMTSHWSSCLAITEAYSNKNCFCSYHPIPKTLLIWTHPPVSMVEKTQQMKPPTKRSMVIWLVVWTVLKNMSSSMGRIIPYIYIYIYILWKIKMFETTNQLTSNIPMKSPLMTIISVLDYEINPHYL